MVRLIAVFRGCLFNWNWQSCNIQTRLTSSLPSGNKVYSFWLSDRESLSHLRKHHVLDVKIFKCTILGVIYLNKKLFRIQRPHSPWNKVWPFHSPIRMLLLHIICCHHWFSVVWIAFLELCSSFHDFISVLSALMLLTVSLWTVPCVKNWVNFGDNRDLDFSTIKLHLQQVIYGNLSTLKTVPSFVPL